MSPDEGVFRAHLAGGRFRSGAASGRWRLVSVAWPYAVFGVRASDDIEYGLRFECTDYPSTPPTAGLGDIAPNGPLAVNKWPSGPERIALAFEPACKSASC